MYAIFNDLTKVDHLVWATQVNEYRELCSSLYIVLCIHCSSLPDSKAVNK